MVQGKRPLSATLRAHSRSHHAPTTDQTALSPITLRALVLGVLTIVATFYWMDISARANFTIAGFAPFVLWLFVNTGIEVLTYFLIAPPLHCQNNSRVYRGVVSMGQTELCLWRWIRVYDGRNCGA